VTEGGLRRRAALPPSQPAWARRGRRGHPRVSDVRRITGELEALGRYAREPRPPIRTPAALQSLWRAQPDRTAGHGSAAAGRRVGVHTVHAKWREWVRHRHWVEPLVV